MTKNNQGGFSLAGVLVAAAMVGMIGMAIMQIITQTTTSQKNAELRSDLESIRVMVRQSVDCERTVAELLKNGGCSIDNYIDLYKKGGTKIVEKSGEVGTQVGNWFLRASCNPPLNSASGYIVVEVKGNLPNNHDPVMGKYKNYSNLLGSDTASFCSAALPGSGTALGVLGCDPSAATCEEKNMTVVAHTTSSINIPVLQTSTLGGAVPIGSRVVTAMGPYQQILLSGELAVKGRNRETQVSLTVTDIFGKEETVVYKNQRMLILRDSSEDDEPMRAVVTNQATFNSVSGHRYEYQFNLVAVDSSSGPSSVSGVSSLNFQISHLAN